MNSQAHPGLTSSGLELPRATRARTVASTDARGGRRTVTVLAAAAIEVLVAVAVVAMSIGVGSTPRAVSGRSDAAPFVTPAPEAPPTPRPGF